ncbi:hypothetical protein ACJX0J_018527 [Zea mays]
MHTLNTTTNQQGKHIGIKHQYYWSGICDWSRKWIEYVSLLASWKHDKQPNVHNDGISGTAGFLDQNKEGGGGNNKAEGLILTHYVDYFYTSVVVLFSAKIQLMIQAHPS